MLGVGTGEPCPSAPVVARHLPHREAPSLSPHAPELPVVSIGVRVRVSSGARVRVRLLWLHYHVRWQTKCCSEGWWHKSHGSLTLCLVPYSTSYVRVLTSGSGGGIFPRLDTPFPIARSMQRARRQGDKQEISAATEWNHRDHAGTMVA